MAKKKLMVVFETEVLQALLEQQEQKDYETIQMVIYDILGEWRASKIAPAQGTEFPPKKPILLTLQKGLSEQLAQEQVRKGYATLQMVIYDIVGEWYARQQQEEV